MYKISRKTFVYKLIYRMDQKMAPFLYSLTLPTINQFSKLFHYQNQEKICDNTITKDPTTPQAIPGHCVWLQSWNSRNWKPKFTCLELLYNNIDLVVFVMRASSHWPALVYSLRLRLRLNVYKSLVLGLNEKVTKMFRHPSLILKEVKKCKILPKFWTSVALGSPRFEMQPHEV